MSPETRAQRWGRQAAQVQTGSGYCSTGGHGWVPGLSEPPLSSVEGLPPGGVGEHSSGPGRPLWVSGGEGRGVLGGGQGRPWPGEGPP